MLTDRIEYDVVRLPVPREVLPLVVDDLVGAERADELDVAAVADGRHVGTEVRCKLHGRGPERAGSAVDH